MFKRQSKFIKPIILLFTIFIVSFVQVKRVDAQNAFNGKMKFKVQDENGKSSYITYLFQDGNMRADLPASDMGGKVYMIVKNKSMYVVMPGQKMYIKYSGSLNKLMKFNSDKNEKKPDWKKIMAMAKTGKTKTILGYHCSEFFLPNDNGGGMHIWATTDLGNIAMAQNPMTPNPMLSAINKLGGYFPLLTEETNGAGKTVSKSEVVTMQKKNIDDNLFKIPSNYKKMNMPGMK